MLTDNKVRGCSSMAEHELPKLAATVRFRSPAPGLFIKLFFYVTCAVAIFGMQGCTTTGRSVKPVSVYDISGVGSVQYHTVREGETLWRISRTYGVDLDTLIQQNHLSPNGALEKGQVITIPRAKQIQPKKILVKNYYGDEPWIGDFGSSAGDVGWMGKELIKTEREIDTDKNTYFGMFDYGNDLAGEMHNFTGIANFIEWPKSDRPDSPLIV